MNWKEIKEKYPKGFEKLQDHFNAHEMAYGETPCHSWSDQYGKIDGQIYPRDLYDFFDEQKLSIEVFFDYDVWNYRIHSLSENGHLYKYKHGFKNRTESESAAFTKAFEILEVK